MRHLRPTLVLVAALGLFTALAGLVAFARRQDDLAHLPRSAPAFTALRPPLPSPQATAAPAPAPISVTLVLLTAPGPAAVDHWLRQATGAASWAAAPVRPEPWSLPVRLAMALTGADPAQAGPDLYPNPATPGADLLANPDNVLRAAQTAGRTTACVRLSDLPAVALDSPPCAPLPAGAALPTADLLLVVARTDDLPAATGAARLLAASPRLTLLVAESPDGVAAAWGHLWLIGPGVVPNAGADPVARADVAATTAALLGVPPPGGNRGHILDAWLPRPAEASTAAHLALLRGRVALLRHLRAGLPPGPLAAQTLDSLGRTAEVAADDLRLGNVAGAVRLLAPALDQADRLLADSDAARSNAGRATWLLPVVLGLLLLGGGLAWLARGAPLAVLGRRRVAAALLLGGGAWLAGQGLAGLAGAWSAARWLPEAAPALSGLLVGAGALAVAGAGMATGLIFERLVPPRPAPRSLILVPSARLVQRLRTPSAGPPLLALGAIAALGALAAAVAWGLVAGWATGGPVASWIALPAPGLLAAHLGGLLGLAGAGLATPLAPFLAWGVVRLRGRGADDAPL